MALFEGHKTAHGTHGEPKRNGLKWEIKNSAKTLREPVTDDLWKQHLDGKRPIGIIPINEAAMCFWGSIDVDEYDIDLLKIVKDADKYPLVPCKSKSGGLHLFLFTSQPVAAGDMQSTLRALAASMGLAGSEIFPKQSNVLTERGDVGNWMVMPYFGGTFGGKLHNQHGLKRTGAEQTLQEFINHSNKKRLSTKKFEELANSMRTSKVTPVNAGGKGKRGKKGGTVGHGPFGDGPPCLQHMATGGFPEGGRNNALFMLGIYLKRAFPVDWHRRLEEDNQTFMKPPLTSDEVTQVRKQLERKDYEYTCKVEPMQSHCDTGICRTRKFGVGDSGTYPSITSMTKMNSEPAIWFVDMGERRLEISTADLLQYARFQHVVAENCGVFLSSMKQSDWVQILGEASRNMETIDPPPDLRTQGRFEEYIVDFLTNRTRGLREEDILSGRPWFDESTGRHYFSMKDFTKFLEREGAKDFTRGQLARRIIRMGGGHVFRKIKGKHGRNLQFVPNNALEHTPVVSTPEPEGDDV